MDTEAYDRAVADYEKRRRELLETARVLLNAELIRCPQAFDNYEDAEIAVRRAAALIAAVDRTMKEK